MSVAADSSPAHNTHAARQRSFAALLDQSQHSQLDGSFQVPDSDNDESLEELAEQQEQEYWSMLGVEDVLLPVYGSSPPSSAPLVTSIRARSRSPLVHDPDVARALSASPLPSLSNFGRPKSQSRNSAENDHVVASPLVRWSSSMSPDPLLLPNQSKGSPATRSTLARFNLISDEGYQTKTDSDHVMHLGDSVSVEPVDVNVQQAETQDSRRSLTPLSSDFDTLPPPLTAKSEPYERKIDDRFLSSPLSSPAGSPERPIASTDNNASPKDTVKGSPEPQENPEQVERLVSEGTTFEEGAAPVRQFRQRKAVQLAPYSTEFSKFASLANKNSWQGIISAGLRQAFLEKEREKAESQKRQRDPSDEWLVQGNEQEEEQESDFSEPLSEPTSPRRKRRSTLGSDIDVVTHARTSVERYSRSHREREWDPVANRLKAARKPSETIAKGNIHSGRSSHATSSKVTLEDLERSAAKRAKRKGEVHSSRKQNHKARNVAPHHDHAARAAQISQARRVGLLPSDVESSSSEKADRSSRKKQSTGVRTPTHRPSLNDAATVIDSSDASSSDSGGPLGSDSPDRPVASRKERFTLKGKRKRAAMFMMPAVALKKAEADLRLMEQEMEQGKQVRLEEPHDDGNSQGDTESVTAKKRWRPQNANRPFRYVTELSTDDSASDSDRNDPQTNDNDETQSAMQAWTSMATGKHHPGSAPVKQDNRYWDKLIGRILVRSNAASGVRRRRKRKNANEQHNTNQDFSHNKGRERNKSALRPRQSHLGQHFVTPVYLDTADRLFDNALSGFSAKRARHRSRVNREAFWKVMAGPPSTQALAYSSAAAQHATLATPLAPVQSKVKGTIDETEGSAKFARFSFDYNIERLPIGLTFTPSSYLGAGHLQELICHMKMEPTYSLRTPVTPFGIGLDSTMPSEVLMQILPRLIDCLYEYTIGETAPSHLNGPINQAVRFLSYYALIYISEESTCDVTRAAIFNHLTALETRLEGYVAEVDSVDGTLSSTMIAFKWAMLEMSILAYAEMHRTSGAAAKQTARHHILESMMDFARSLLQGGPAAMAKALCASTVNLQDGDVRIQLKDIHCEAWVCLINLSAVGQTIEAYAFLSLASFWHTVEHCLNEEAIERNMHQIVRGETASFVAMILCALSQFNTGGVSGPKPQLTAHWSILIQVLSNVKTQDFAQTYNAMSSPNRTRTCRYIWTVFARCLNMASRWDWPLLDQGKIIGKLFDILDSRQLQDFCIDGDADFPAFLSNFTGEVSTQLDSDDTTLHIFLRILSQAAFESSQRNDKKATMALARIAMRVMPMREHLPYARHSIAGKVLDRSVLVNHCALLIVLAVIDPSTSERRLEKLKTILDFVSSDSRARQDYLKAIMFMGIVYKVRGMDLTPVLSWLTHTADYLCQTYTQCAKRRAILLASKRKAALAQKNVQHNFVKPGGRHGSVPASNAVIEKEIYDVNREMGETAVMEGLLLGAVQQIMLTAPQEDASNSASYPSLEYLDKSWTTQVLCSPLARDPVAGSQVLQCLQNFLNLRNEFMRQFNPIPQGESQDEFGDMDFDYDDPALNAMLGLPEVEKRADEAEQAGPRASQLDQQFIEMIKSSISPRLYAILSDSSAISAGQDLGVPEFPNKATYIDNVTGLWASCAVVLVQKGQRDWYHFMDPFGKESWQRFADVLRRFEIGCVFSCVMLANDGKAYKSNRSTLLQIMFRRLAAPVPSAHDAQLLTYLLNLDASFVLWQSLPFEVDELVNQYLISATELTTSRMALFRSIFSICKNILARETITLRGLERSSAAVCREQQFDNHLLYLCLGYLLSSLRDFLDSLKITTSPTNGLAIKEYAAYCRQVVFLMKEEMGSDFVTENNIPSLRLLAGVINGTIS